MPRRVANYSTTLPTAGGGRRAVAYTASVALHLVLLAFLLYRATHGETEATRQRAAEETTRPIQLVFAPPRPVPTPRPVQPPPAAPVPQPPAVPLTPGPDQTPGTTAKLTPTPEQNPNAAPNTTRTEATRPDPGDAEKVSDGHASAPPPAAIAAPTPAAPSKPTLESEAERIFGRPSSKLGPVAGMRDNRPWESPVDLNSRGCSLPEEPQDSTLPAGMARVMGRIYNERTGEPLANARLQIVGTQYGAFSNERGEYALYFDRHLVDRCRSQSVRVTAPGYEGRDVILYVGATPNGDVPLRRY